MRGNGRLVCLNNVLTWCLVGRRDWALWCACCEAESEMATNLSEQLVGQCLCSAVRDKRQYRLGNALDGTLKSIDDHFGNA